MRPLRDKPSISQDIELKEGKRLLEQGAEALGFSLSVLQLEQFCNYMALLQKWNRVVNLTGLRSCQEIVLKHFLDSLTPLPYLPEQARILDVGSGAGFPGLPIKICRPDQSVTLIEATSKKANFLREVIRQLKLKNTQVVQGYLDQATFPQLPSSQFDIITARAVGKVIELLSWVSTCLPYGGKLMLMKGKQGLKEIADLEIEIQKKGFQIESPIHLTLPFLDQERILIFLTKK